MSYDKSPPAPAPAPYVIYATPAYGTPLMNPYAMQTTGDASLVRDYLIWSIINIFCGWGIFGFVPLVFSLLCRNNKSMNNYSGARSMSTLALVSNIIITIGGVIGWISFVIVMSLYIEAMNNNHQGYNN